MANLLKDIMLANYHKGGCKILKVYGLDVQYFKHLQEEVLRFCDTQRPSDVTSKAHVTNWTDPVGSVLQYSIYNESGKANDTSGDHTTFGNKKFHYPIEYPCLNEFVQTFAGIEIMGVRINLIAGKSGLNPHEEHNVHRRAGKTVVRVRFHIPVVTNDKCYALLDGEHFKMEEGNIYFFNNGCVHASFNDGEQDRYHIVWDMMMTKKCHDLMFKDGLNWNRLVTIPKKEKQVDPIAQVKVDKYETYKPEVPYDVASDTLDYL